MVSSQRVQQNPFKLYGSFFKLINNPWAAASLFVQLIEFFFSSLFFFFARREVHKEETELNTELNIFLRKTKGRNDPDDDETQRSDSSLLFDFYS